MNFYERREIGFSPGHPSLYLLNAGTAVDFDVSGGTVSAVVRCAHDVESLNAILREFLYAFGKLVREEPSPCENDDPATQAEAAACHEGNVERVRNMAQLGRDLFEALIPVDQRRGFIAALRSGQLVDGGAPGASRPFVSLSTAASRIPWNLMFLGSELPSRADEVEGFLGAQVLFLGRADSPPSFPERDFTALVLEDPAIVDLVSVDGPDRIGHVWDDQFLGLPDNEHWYRPGKLEREELKAFNEGDNTAAERSGLIMSFVSKPRSRLHFDCHAQLNPFGLFDKHAIGIRNSLSESYANISAWDFMENENLLITLNVCHAGSGELGPGKKPGLAQLLKSRGAGATIAPMTLTPYPLAMRLMEALHSRTGAGRSYLNAFDEAQAQMMKRDVAALVYVCFGDLSFLAGGLGSDALADAITCEAA